MLDGGSRDVPGRERYPSDTMGTAGRLRGGCPYPINPNPPRGDSGPFTYLMPRPLQAVEKCLSLFRSLSACSPSRGEILFSPGDLRLHLWMMKPELISAGTPLLIEGPESSGGCHGSPGRVPRPTNRYNSGNAAPSVFISYSHKTRSGRTDLSHASAFSRIRAY